MDLAEFQQVKGQITQELERALLRAEELNPGSLKKLFQSWSEGPPTFDIDKTASTLRRFDAVKARFISFVTNEDPQDELEQAVLILERLADEADSLRSEEDV